MTANSESKRSIELPVGWQITHMAIHYEGEDVSRDEHPFAANVLVQLRMDAIGSTPAELAISDLAILDTLPDAERISAGPIPIEEGGRPAQHVELTFRPDGGGVLQQLIVYIGGENRVYTVTGTHRAGPRFDKIRGDVLHVARSLLSQGVR